MEALRSRRTYDYRIQETICETGDRDLLKEIEKGATPEEMVEAGRKAKKAGFEYSLYVLLGIGDDAAVVNASGPLAIATDTLVDGVHFPKRTAADAIAISEYPEKSNHVRSDRD